MGLNLRLREFKSNRIVVYIGVFIPIIFLSILLFIFWDNLSIIYLTMGTDWIGILLTFFIIPNIFYYFSMIMSSINNDKRNIIPFNMKSIYSQHGNYFMKKKRKKESEIYICNIFVNKYWIFLSKINEEPIHFKGNIEKLQKDIKDVIFDYNRLGLVYDDLGSSLNEWSGSIDKITERNRAIDETLRF